MQSQGRGKILVYKETGKQIPQRHMKIVDGPGGAIEQVQDNGATGERKGSQQAVLPGLQNGLKDTGQPGE
jgi:hypothetical protein